ncbi:antibiotic biosynthesis monooxygenase [Flavobacterium sp. WLB]|uniref:putative quinol monooxygenase n=1 Tax=unclassified Flavobacterium TaxID=196869 RepID=UPI0006ABE154|nr:MULTISPECIES: putative quinol monooxygenase [unclassified Flavobacterium]KOP39754.1 antibiotic biosynthesis monooxygenase [Flavobacterium sp. VMW]OWU92538.1 antibiotic biosynthesis monooxygenase [Flavobacterium sp. NLM]PUU71033.1 antibiotic biosynthesis monooxygenase [Flavobacterium sp. WLB]
MKNQNPIHVFATWKVKEGQIENVLQLLQTVQEKSIQESGNLFYNIHQSITDLNTIVLFEGYTNEDAVTEHRNTAHFQDLVLGQIVPLLDERNIILTLPIE